MEDTGWYVSALLRALGRAFLWFAEWIYILGRRPGYDWTTGRRSSNAYRVSWHVGRAWFWLPLALIAAVLIFLVYFGPRITL